MSVNIFLKRRIQTSIPPVPETEKFITSWNITSGDTVILPLSGVSDCLIEWGDGDSNRYSGAIGDRTHTYTSTAIFDIKINGLAPNFLVDGDSSIDTKIVELKNWGTVLFSSINFTGCSNMTVSAADIPDWSNCTSFNYLFRECDDIVTIPNIDSWDISTITSLYGTFYRCRKFNQSLNSWDTSNVVDLSWTFYDCDIFNGNISSWDTSSVVGQLRATFRDAFKFNQDISGWDVSGITNLQETFENCKVFNQPLNSWDVSNVTILTSCFENCYLFNQPLNLWDVSNVTAWSSALKNMRSFNQNIDGWNVNKSTGFSDTFAGMYVWNPTDLSGWNPPNLVTLRGAFNSCYLFNTSVNHFDTKNVTDINGCFEQARAFNQPLNLWDVSNVINFGDLFFGALVFNQDISGWDVGSGTIMEDMFRGCSFNQDISGWDVSNVYDMTWMFYGNTAFNQDISGWDVTSLTQALNFMKNALSFSTVNYDLLLNSWSTQAVKNNVEIGFDNTKYTIATSQSARDILTGAFLWLITDNGGI